MYLCIWPYYIPGTRVNAAEYNVEEDTFPIEFTSN